MGSSGEGLNLASQSAIHRDSLIVGRQGQSFAVLPVSPFQYWTPRPSRGSAGCASKYLEGPEATQK
jgi:hypothetical protein